MQHFKVKQLKNAHFNDTLINGKTSFFWETNLRTQKNMKPSQAYEVHETSSEYWISEALATMGNHENSKTFFQKENSTIRIQADYLFNLFHGDKLSHILTFAHELNLFSLIGEGRGKSLEDIRAYFNWNARSTQALLSICTSLGLLMLKDNKYILTEISKKFLVSSSPLFQSDLLSSVGLSLYSYPNIKKAFLKSAAIPDCEKNQDLLVSTTKRLCNKSALAAKYWAKVVDFSKNKIFLDIGGGTVAHSIEAITKWRNLHAIIYDAENILDSNRQAFDFRDKISYCSGDMWVDPLPLADIHFFANVFHSWSVEGCKFLINKSYEHLSKKGKIVIHEMLFNDYKTGPRAVSLYNLTTLLSTEGQQLSRRELHMLLQESGFKNIVTIETGLGDWSITIAEKED